MDQIAAKAIVDWAGSKETKENVEFHKNPKIYIIAPDGKKLTSFCHTDITLPTYNDESTVPKIEYYIYPRI